MLEGCEARLSGLLAARRREDEALCAYFGEYGAEHADEDCPEDDTCECPLVEAMNLASRFVDREVEWAGRRIQKIRKMRKELAALL